MSHRDSFQPGHWYRLTRAPWAAMTLVSMADERISLKELFYSAAYLGNMIEKAPENSFEREVLSECLDAGMDFMEEYGKNENEFNESELVSLLQSTASVVEEHLDEEKARIYKSRLHRLSELVARTTRGKWGFGKKITEGERSVLNRINEIFPYDET